jgi:uncharacterized membrane protein
LVLGIDTSTWVEGVLMNLGVRLLLFGLAFCACVLLVCTTVGAQGPYEVDLELNDTAPVKTAMGTELIQFNFTVEHNGTNASEEVVITIDNASEGWSFVLVSETRHDIYTGTDSIEVLLESGEVAPLSVTVTPPDVDLNMTHWFGVNATVKQDVTSNETVYIGVTIPAFVDFRLEVWNPPPGGKYQAIPPYTVTIRFALFNSGNAPDTFLVQGSSSLSDDGWVLGFVNGVDEFGRTEELPPDIHETNPYFIDVKVPIPEGTDADVESVVSLNATSINDTSLQRPSAMATVVSLLYNNFQVYISGPDKKEGIPGETVTFQLKINNSGNGPDTFSVEAIYDDVLNPDFVAYAEPSNITIGRDVTATLTYYVEVPERAPKKTYFFTAEIRSSSPELAPVTKSFGVEVGQFYGIRLSCDEPSRETVPGGNLEFELTVNNTGNGLDFLIVDSLQGVPFGWLTYTQPPEVTLLQDQNATIKVIVIIPSQFEDVPQKVYKVTVPVVSSMSHIEDSLDLTIDIGHVWRIEWMWWHEDITNPERPTAQPGAVHPRPVIDLLNETTTSVVLELKNYGNAEDTVTLQLENDFTQYLVEVEPMEFTLERGESQDVTVTITVPRDLVGGVYYCSLMATSSDESLVVRQVGIQYEIVPVYSADDFSPWSVADDRGDDYAFTFTAEEAGGIVTSSRGRLDRAGNVDFLNVNSGFDIGNGTVVVTLIFEDGPMDDPATEYWVYFVDEHHRQGGPLLRPGIYNEGEFNWTFSDQAHTIVGLWYSDGEWGSTGNLTDVEVSTAWNGITFNISSRELRREGVDPGSGFGVYAYAQTMITSVNDEYRMRVVWDSAGLGAARPPAEFTNEQDDVPAPSYLAPLALVVAAATLVVLVGLGRRRRGGGAQ